MLFFFGPILPLFPRFLLRSRSHSFNLRAPGAARSVTNEANMGVYIYITVRPTRFSRGRTRCYYFTLKFERLSFEKPGPVFSVYTFGYGPADGQRVFAFLTTSEIFSITRASETTRTGRKRLRHEETPF